MILAAEVPGYIYAGSLLTAFIGAIVALIKVRPEGTQVIIQTAETAVTISARVAVDLDNRLKALERKYEEAQADLRAVTVERDQLRDRVAHLEDEVTELRGRLDPPLTTGVP